MHVHDRRVKTKSNSGKRVRQGRRSMASLKNCLTSTGPPCTQTPFCLDRSRQKGVCVHGGWPTNQPLCNNYVIIVY